MQFLHAALLPWVQVVIKQDSNLTEFYSAALRPWVHFVPVGFEGLHEVDWAVQFLRENDDLARAIGENGRQFAHQHLNLEGRLCYIKVWHEQLAGNEQRLPWEPVLLLSWGWVRGQVSFLATRSLMQSLYSKAPQLLCPTDVLGMHPQACIPLHPPRWPHRCCLRRCGS